MALLFQGLLHHPIQYKYTSGLETEEPAFKPHLCHREVQRTGRDQLPPSPSAAHHGEKGGKRITSQHPPSSKTQDSRMLPYQPGKYRDSNCTRQD